MAAITFRKDIDVAKAHKYVKLCNSNPHVLPKKKIDEVFSLSECRFHFM
jgi:hypothetical protein